MAARIRRPYTEARDYIRIEGQAVKLVSEQVTRVIKLEDYMALMAGYDGLVTPILPNGCKFLRQKQGNSVIIVEKPPQVRQLIWRGMITSPANRETISWRLAFPYTVFVLGFNSQLSMLHSRIFYRTTPINSIQDMLCHTNLCNVYANSTICTGSVRATGDSLAEKVDTFIAGFWQSEFNTDLVSDNFNRDRVLIPKVSNIEAWQSASREDPLFPLAERWRDFESIADLLETI